MFALRTAAAGAWVLAGAITAPPAQGALSGADHAAIFTAAGFSQAADGRPVRCQEVGGPAGVGRSGGKVDRSRRGWSIPPGG